LSVRLPADYVGGEPLKDDRRTKAFESRTHDWKATKKRLEELATIVGILATVVAPELALPGALIGAGVAAAELYARWQNDTLRPDASLITDVLSVLSAITATTTTLGKLSLVRAENGRFVLVAAEQAGKFTNAVAKFDELLLNPASVMWGDALVIDKL